METIQPLRPSIRLILDKDVNVVNAPHNASDSDLIEIVSARGIKPVELFVLPEKFGDIKRYPNIECIVVGGSRIIGSTLIYDVSPTKTPKGIGLSSLDVIDDDILSTDPLSYTAYSSPAEINARIATLSSRLKAEASKVNLLDVNSIDSFRRRISHLEDNLKFLTDINASRSEYLEMLLSKDLVDSPELDAEYVRDNPWYAVVRPENSKLLFIDNPKAKARMILEYYRKETDPEGKTKKVQFLLSFPDFLKEFEGHKKRFINYDPFRVSLFDMFNVSSTLFLRYLKSQGFNQFSYYDPETLRAKSIIAGHKHRVLDVTIDKKNNIPGGKHLYQVYD